MTSSTEDGGGVAFEDLVVDVHDGEIAVITLNRPERLNALRWQTYAELERAVRSLTCRVLVVTGAGRGFCAGDDVREVLNSGEEPVAMEDGLGLDPTTRALLEAPFPVIAAVNGVAAGWGLDLALLADLRVASTTARFVSLYVSRGQCPDVASLARLAQLIGRERAVEMLLTDREMKADEAASAGLVASVVDPEQLMSATMELARTIASRPPLAVAAVKAGIRRASEPDWESLGRWAADVHAALFRTNDHREAVQSFVERRPGRFTGT